VEIINMSYFSIETPAESLPLLSQTRTQREIRKMVVMYFLYGIAVLLPFNVLVSNLGFL